MPKYDVMEFEGTVVEAMPGATFKVKGGLTQHELNM